MTLTTYKFFINFIFNSFYMKLFAILLTHNRKAKKIRSFVFEIFIDKIIFKVIVSQ